MKVDELNLLSTCFMAAAVVVSLTAPTRSQNNISGNETQTSSRRYDSDGFPALVGVYTLLFKLYFFLLQHDYSISLL